MTPDPRTSTRDHGRTATTVPDNSRTFTFIDTRGIPFFSRVKIALSIALTPITLPIIGRSIRVTYRSKEA